ncbi:siderophore-interacting protein [Streptacidiphilus albus]|uniref:siderophore-interacting protein n=1 Tax=Streptacidiphilus albus TaxID=105425 RepID=UPI00054B0C53|nr:siderophore-interacting protein [Streptacidiphilus albus]
MTNPRQARKATSRRAVVLRTEQLTPHMVRVVLGGDGLADLTVSQNTDSYVKLLFPAVGAEQHDLSDLAELRASLPRTLWPRTRTYTIRHWDQELRELTIDFVQHGAKGVAGPWATTVSPGAEVHFGGPGGGYAPDPEAAWHLLAGDESALPAIAAAVEALPEGARAVAFIEVADHLEEQPVAAPAGAEIVWLHRGARRIGELLVERVSALEFLPGEPQVFVHGEANFVKQLRHHLRTDRGLPRELLSISGYWRQGMDEDGWQSSKSTWNAQVELEEQKALVTVGTAAQDAR